jgi:hypothetical protein
MNFILETYLKNISICDDLIDLFNKRDDKYPGESYRGVDLDVKESTDLSIPVTQQLTIPSVSNYIEQLSNCVVEYINKFPWCNEYGGWGLTESLNIQYYKPGEAYHAYHCERCNHMQPLASRHLVWMTYLNDVTDEGGTEFYHQEFIVTPKKGKTLIWPVDWTYTHRGIPSPTQEKYIITGWFSYMSDDSIELVR